MLRYGTTQKPQTAYGQAFAVALAYPVVVAGGTMPFGWAACFMVHLPLMSRLRPWKASSILGLKHVGIHHLGTTIIDVSPHRIVATRCIGAQSRFCCGDQPCRVAQVWRYHAQHGD